MHSRRWKVALLLLLVTGTFWAASARGRQFLVTQKNRMFPTDMATIQVGDKIVFQNLDDVTHNVYSNSKGNEFDIRVQRPGGSTSVTFWSEGVAEIRCAIHPKMKMTIVVKK